MRTACSFFSFQGEVPAIRFHESVYDTVCEIDFDDLTQSFDMS